MNLMSYRESKGYRSIRRRLSTRPTLYRVLAKIMGSERLLRQETNLVVDGFPRSANSYIEAAFNVSQAGKGIYLSSHSHASGQVVAAVRRNLPTVVLYRNPDDAVASYMHMSASSLSMNQLFLEYVTFYKTILPLSDQVVLASFPSVTCDFPSIVKKVNAKFNIELLVPTMDLNFEQEVSAWRDKTSLARSGRVTLYSESNSKGSLLARQQQLAAFRETVAEFNGPSREEAIKLFQQLKLCDEESAALERSNALKDGGKKGLS